jgi:hypothetical protein
MNSSLLPAGPWPGPFVRMYVASMFHDFRVTDLNLAMYGNFWNRIC